MGLSWLKGEMEARNLRSSGMHGAVFADPGGSGCDVFEAEHVEEGYLDDDSDPHLGCWVNSTCVRCFSGYPPLPCLMCAKSSKEGV